jgi:hypothetical protein
MQKMVETLQRNHVGIPTALEAQHYETDILVFCPLFQPIETPIQFRCRAKK